MTEVDDTLVSVVLTVSDDLEHPVDLQIKLSSTSNSKNNNITNLDSVIHNGSATSLMVFGDPAAIPVAPPVVPFSLRLYVPPVSQLELDTTDEYVIEIKENENGAETDQAVGGVGCCSPKDELSPDVVELIELIDRQLREMEQKVRDSLLISTSTTDTDFLPPIRAPDTPRPTTRSLCININDSVDNDGEIIISDRDTAKDTWGTSSSMPHPLPRRYIDMEHEDHPLSTRKPRCSLLHAQLKQLVLSRLHRRLITQMLQVSQHTDEWKIMEHRRIRVEALMTQQQHLQVKLRRARSFGYHHSTHQPASPSSASTMSTLDLDSPLSLPTAPNRCGSGAAHSSALTSSHSFHCPICLNDCPSYTGIMLPCSHFLCSACLTLYLSTMITQGEVTLRCPCFIDRPCTAVLSSNIIIAYTSAAAFSHYQRICAQKRDSRLRACPYCSHAQIGSRWKPKMTCTQCQRSYCYHHSNAHPNTNCRTYLKQQRATTRDSLATIAMTTVQCPSCHVPVEKESGCNHLTCTHCQTEFCYLCGSRYLCGFHFYEYNFAGCPSMQHVSGLPNERNTCLRRCYRYSIGYPLLMLLIPTILLVCLSLFVTVEALWLALFLACSPVLLFIRCCCHGWFYRLSWKRRERIQFWMCFGPQLASRLSCSCCC